MSTYRRIHSRESQCARFYADVFCCRHYEIKRLSTKIREQEMKVYETKITMKTLEAEEALASFMIKQVKI